MAPADAAREGVVHLQQCFALATVDRDHLNPTTKQKGEAENYSPILLLS
jgi:hypothetical protein